MKETFRWNPLADQPHNVAPKNERLRFHFRHAGSYLPLLFANLRKLAPGLKKYRQYRKIQYAQSVRIGDPFAVAVSPVDKRNEDVLSLLEETGARKTLLRLASWEIDRLDRVEEFAEQLKKRDFDILFALLQRRDDVLHPEKWEDFVERAFERFRRFSPLFEIGHAWNRTKWGVWDYTEYLDLAKRALPLAQKHRVRTVGPAVIDFEFHLYPPVLKKIPFEVISSLLYVDRVGAPETKQAGWDTAKKLALLRATVNACVKERPLWITEFNWPLLGTGDYSPASGKPNVTEDAQASYLVRYCVLCLATGFVERIYWWQLVAPGYGLIDNREEPWRKRPGFFAFKTLVSALKDTEFLEKLPHDMAEIFVFSGKDGKFAVIWTKEEENEGRTLDAGSVLGGHVERVVDRDGKENEVHEELIKLSGRPQYVYFKEK